MSLLVPATTLPGWADELGVAAVLEGSVRRTADAVRISVQLREARSGEHLWAESHDRQLPDIFRIQTDAATRVVTEFRGVLTPEERAEMGVMGVVGEPAMWTATPA